MDKKEYERSYHLKRYHTRRAEAVQQLGGVCIVCGSDDNLELDHIDPATKSIDIGKLWSVSKSRYQAEVLKCQLLCKVHHIEKTVSEQKTRTHGTPAMYRREKCRCEPCVKANSKYQSQYSKYRVWCNKCKKYRYKQCKTHASAV